MRLAIFLGAFLLSAGCDGSNGARDAEDATILPLLSAPVATPRATAKPAAEPANVTYANCDAVRAAGAAPIRIGEPGYSTKLDRDGDGVGCE